MQHVKHIKEIISALRNDSATEDEIIRAMIDFDDNLTMEETISPLKDTPLKNPSKRTVGNTSLEKKDEQTTKFCRYENTNNKQPDQHLNVENFVTMHSS